MRLDSLALKYGTDKSSAFHNYARIYETLLASTRVSSVLELGVYHGGSLKMWAEYFPESRIVGVDLNPDCAAIAADRIHVRIGNQSDTKFIAEVVKEFGPFDLIIDDGGHYCDDQQISFEALFPALAPNGWYFIEDLITSYIPKFIGERGPTTAWLMSVINNINVNGKSINIGYSGDKEKTLKDLGDTCTVMETLTAELHVYPGLCAVKKRGI